MSESNLINLTDAELQNKLLYFGLPKVPVTETTRKILFKKLEALVQNEYNDNKSNKSFSRSNIDSTLIMAGNRLKFPTGSTLNRHNDHKASYAAFELGNVNRKTYWNANMQTATDLNFSSQSSVDTSYSKKQAVASDTASQNTSGVDYNSGMVNRLLRFRDTNVEKYTVGNSADIKNMDKNLCYVPNRAISRKTTWRDLILKAFLPCTGFKHVFVPITLFGTFILFFFVLTAAYVAKIPQIPAIHEDSTEFRVCEYNVKEPNVHRTDCVVNLEMVQTSVRIAQDLNKLLYEKTLQHHCIDSSVSEYVTFHELYKQLSKTVTGYTLNNLRNDIQVVVYLAMNNPKWKISVENIKDFPLNTSKNSLEAIENVRFVVKSPNLPWKCTIFKKVQRYFFIVGIMCSSIFVLIVVYFLVRFILNYKRQRALQVSYFAKEIINALGPRSRNSSDIKDNEIILNHLRDEILPLKTRGKHLKHWNEAVKLLEETDSRIVFGVTVINGEHFKFVKWNKEEPSIDSPYFKKWQSPAFSSANRVIYPPTPCLKIRHMFESTEIGQKNLKAALLKAVVQRVGENCQIEDFQLDLESCCVYIRCKTVKDAGLIHNEINGWWFDNRLISIKFLHLNRFLCRFPETFKMKQ